MNKIYIATTSPRRIKLLKDFDFRFELLVPCKEHSEHEEPYLRVKKRAKSKIECLEKDGILAGFDTIVVLKDTILEKPLTHKDAKKMLMLLSEKWHNVITAIAIKHKGIIKTFTETTKVKFRKIHEEEIDFAFTKYNPLDKAGAYGIQDFSGIFVEKIHGDYYNVVGLPAGKFYSVLKKDYGCLLECIFKNKW